MRAIISQYQKDLTGLLKKELVMIVTNSLFWKEF